MENYYVMKYEYKYGLYMDKYKKLCEMANLVELKLEYIQNKDIFESYKYDIMYFGCKYGHLKIVKWMMSLDNHLSSIHLYTVALHETCETRNMEILDYLYSLNIFQTVAINTEAFLRIFYTPICNYDINFMDYMYSLFRLDITDEWLHSHFIFRWACKQNLIGRARWIISKKPYHYELTVNEHDKDIIFYRVVPEKERRWNQLKTILWMSQVKPIPPNKPSIFRRIPDDVVQAEICCYL